MAILFSGRLDKTTAAGEGTLAALDIPEFRAAKSLNHFVYRLAEVVFFQFTVRLRLWFRLLLFVFMTLMFNVCCDWVFFH